ncbi:hypothetical protein KJ865_15325, partial [Myxococcota bacterium]|nr:hypothetical protein [Myxococcota bacterium]
RNTLEWHVSDDFVRTRHQLKLHLKLNKSLRGFLLYEFRWDQDSMRVNMQTTALGLLWRVRPHWSLRLMLADEQNRRNRPQWSSVYFAGLSITVTL